MKHSEWIHRATDGATERAVAKRIGISHTTVNTQLQREHLSAENVIKIAEAFDIHPITALIDTGYVAAKWAMLSDIPGALRDATDENLAEEILRRMKRGTATRALTTDVDQLEQARSKRAKSAFPADGIVREWDDSIPHAADSSPDEDALREERGEDLID
ncbi:helix-turn-helix transcriptional regulator [Corynebacterium glucuronolyticum]|uniref:Helix-turn-helix transcriptional regulator n=1 Tax=Corynebacterium glucuronolyticum TaxID=39791 RepID=A0A7T4BN58_9CORY|nr:helix-turn-helix transcriptional regulator [Corynebacterium glucuronolyticum]QQB45326.1 helix-turn-helix transcriptional regulator [Corynebacterium glucuronolyticum]QQB47577.1 helix-turn-helix transcriptional regulator [Corynebacterium glucuronolyticum]WKD64062.1 hypothetical protein CGLUCO_09085 [Corynebacterium glucuronolyticum DSM 44120]SMB82273.1 hypothetical protein SAMN05660745_02601 [Corynebacterium glucuronolyticum]